MTVLAREDTEVHLYALQTRLNSFSCVAEGIVLFENYIVVRK
jgi:hypothetical protein